MTTHDDEIVEDGPSSEPASINSKRKALDELFQSTRRYRESSDYLELLKFVTRFKRYSYFNAALVHIQKPGASYVLRAPVWSEEYNRTIVVGAQPLVMLQPGGPVMFVFDVSDTAGEKLPRNIESPFEPLAGRINQEFQNTQNNCARDGIRIHGARLGSLAAGSIEPTKYPATLVYRDTSIPVQYELLLNTTMSDEAQFGSLVHELGHLYCGHLGTPNTKWWPDRRGLDQEVREFEAESISYLVCKRIGIDTSSESYLHLYLAENDEIPNVSLERVFAVSQLIEQMSRKSLPLRKGTK